MRRRSITGPIVLITIGVLFMMDHIFGMWSFWRETWPVVLVVIGAVKLMERMGGDSHSAHYDSGPQPWGPPSPPSPPPPPGTMGGTGTGTGVDNHAS